jgi:mono/diheme cytochrome c family protein
MTMRKAIIAIIMSALAFGALGGRAFAQDDTKMSKAEKRELFRKGAKLWPVYCSQCHNARPGSEKAPYEWDQIIMHMRTLSNMPASDANAILIYLKSR